MEIGRIFFYILLFAGVTAVLYAWGLIKSQRQEGELINSLWHKGQRVVMKAIARGRKQTRSQLERRLQGLSVSLFYSKNRLSVQDAGTFAQILLQNMVERGLLLIQDDNQTQYYSLASPSRVLSFLHFLHGKTRKCMKTLSENR
ncbi:MAG: hypothetical protein ACOX85_04755 [Candidatus Pararuminococcus gallinarum]|jgi:hypothetical protein